MKNLIKKYYYNEEQNGIKFLSTWTGSGKSYSWTQAVCEILQEERKESESNGLENSCPFDLNKKIFFVTGLKKNLNCDSLKKNILEKGIMTEEEFDKYVLLYLPKTENFINNYSLVRNDLKKIFHSSEVFKTFEDKFNELILLKKHKEKNKYPSAKNIYDIVYKEFDRTQEENFRKLVIKYLKKTKSALGLNRDKFYEYIKNNSKLNWIQILYPGTFLAEKKIIFLSIDKFLTNNMSVLSNDMDIWKSKYISNSFVTIDEVDDAKNRIYTRIIENSENVENIVELFLSGYRALTLDDHDIIMDGLLASKKSIETAKNLRDIAQAIFEDYKLGHRFIMKADENNDNHFIFHTGLTNLTISSNKKDSFGYIRFLKKNNLIYFTENKNVPENDVPIEHMVNRILRFNVYLIRWLVSLTIEYFNKINSYNRKIEEKDSEGETINVKGENSLSHKKAIQTVVSRIFKSQSEKMYYEKVILNMSFPNSTKTKILNLKRYDQTQPLSEANNPLVTDTRNNDVDFLTTGFAIIGFESDSSHNEDTFIKMFRCTESPEKILVDVASRSKVLGISATADSNTVIRNFDFEYIKKHIGSDNIFFTQEEEKDIRNLNKEIFQRYKDLGINIQHEFIGSDLMNIEVSTNSKLNNIPAVLWHQLLGSSLDADTIITKLPNNLYTQKRYYRIASAFKTFWINYEQIPLGYMILNKIPKSKDQSLNLDLLYDLFQIIMDNHRKGYEYLKATDIIVILAGSEFEKEKEELLENFNPQNGHKIIITTYNTAGTGQNLQYKIKKSEVSLFDNIVQVYDRNEKDEIEIDGNFIYIEKPSYIVENKRELHKSNSLMKTLANITSLYHTGTIGKNTFYGMIHDSFEYKENMTKNKKIQEEFLIETQENERYSIYDMIYELSDTRNALSNIIEQAVGRICRTPNKRTNIWITLDVEILNYLNVSHHHYGLMTPEFASLLEYKDNDDTQDSENLQTLKNSAELSILKTKMFIQKELNNIRENPTSKYNWICTRRLVLSKPTVSREEFLKMNPYEQNLYLRLPEKGVRYWYTVEETEKMSNCEVYFRKTEKSVCVSDESSYLLTLMEVPEIKTEFERQKYATSFEENEYILNPVAYNNIYKGALGEIAGEVLLRIIGYELKEVKDDAYEFFDFEMNFNGEINKPLCIDFKNWRHDMSEPQQIFKQIANKAFNYQTSDVIIINIIGPQNCIPYTKTIEDQDSDAMVNVHIIPSLLNYDLSINQDAHVKLRSIVKDFRTHAEN